MSEQAHEPTATDYLHDILGVLEDLLDAVNDIRNTIQGADE